MTDKRETDEDDLMLEAHFAAARAADLGPSDALMARVMADAIAEQEAAQAVPAAGRVAPERVGLRGVFRALGGWPAVAGLSCATLAGIWIGVAPPEALAVTAQSVWGADTLLAWDAGESLFLAEEAL